MSTPGRAPRALRWALPALLAGLLPASILSAETPGPRRIHPPAPSGGEAPSAPATPPPRPAEAAASGEAWFQSAPPALLAHGAVYDPVGDRMIAVGGRQETGSAESAVWEMSLTGIPRWKRTHPLGTAPPPLADHSIVYDPPRQRILLFGGLASTPQNELWELSLSWGIPAWTKLSPAGTPPRARSLHSAIHDPAGDRMIVFWGNDGSGTDLNDVWELDLSGTPTWTKLSTGLGGPPASSGHRAVYDAIRNRMLVFGGSLSTDLWTLDLTTPSWGILLPSGTSPSARIGHTMTYEPLGDWVWLFGGGDTAELWLLQLSPSPAWTQVGSPGAPPARNFHSTVYDPVGDRLLVFGGTTGSSPASILSDSWAFSLHDMSWRHLSGVRRSGHIAVHDTERNRVVLFGGTDGTSLENATWAYSLDPLPIWEDLEPLGSRPPGRQLSAGVYDPVRDRMVIFGGAGSAGNLGDTWELSFSPTPTWTDLAPAGPVAPVRQDHVAVYDSRRDRMIVFGGFSSGGLANDVWALSLSGLPVWEELFPSGTPPSPRLAASAVYDSYGDRMIVFGGLDASTSQVDTWALEFAGGPEWTELTPAGGPPPGRLAASTVYDPARRRMILFGGFQIQPSPPHTYFNDAWALDLSDGTAWTELLPIFRPAERSDHKAVYDPGADRMVVFGGDGDALGRLASTWSLYFGGVVAADPPRLQSTRLLGIVPNPLRDRTRIELELETRKRVRIALYDVRGRLVKELVSGELEPGRHAIGWDGRTRDGTAARGGIYFVHVRAGNESYRDRLVLLR